MPSFAYTALTATGQTQQGTTEAKTQTDALLAVEAMGLMPVAVEEASADGLALVAKKPATGRVKAAHVNQFARQLAGLLTAGVPLARALSILERESANPAAQALWHDIGVQVADGKPLAEAMASHGQVFPSVYVAMVQAGETGGFLDVVLKQIAEFMTREKELKSRVKSAMVYPLVLAIVASLVVTFLLYWFIPKFSGIFDDFGRQLPLLTRIVQGASQTLLDYGPFVLVGLALLVWGGIQFAQSPKGRRLTDQVVLKIPGVGKVMARFALVRFCRMFGTLIGSGVPLVQALRVAKQALGNDILGEALDGAIVDVQEGEALADALARCRQLFPASVTEVLSVAEASGQMDSELLRLADEHEQELDQQLRMLVALAEPLMLLVMASLVGTIVVGMLLPVFDLWDAIE